MKSKLHLRKWMSAGLIAVLLFSNLLLIGCNTAGMDREAGNITDENQGFVSEGLVSGGDVQASGAGSKDGDASGGNAEAPIEEEPQEVEISLVMVGDMLMHMGVVKSGYLDDGTRNYDHLFANVKDLVEEADIAIVNQETILGGEELGFSGYPRFNSPYEVGDAIAAAGFNVVLHATNHTVDKGKEGVINCLNYWRENYPEMAVIGLQDSQELRDTIYVYEQDGVKIAILNYTYSTNGLPLPKDMPYAVNLLDKEAVKKDLEAAKKLADFIIVCPHWGTEYSHSVSSYQKDWAQFFLENDVDLVIGAHPHVIEPVEWLEREDGHKMLVYYSLGNFVNATNSYQEGVADRMVGAMAKVVIKKDVQTGEVFISQYGVEPLVNHYQYGKGYMSSYPLSDYTEELVRKSEAVDRDPAFSLQFCYDLCTRVFGEELMNGMITVEESQEHDISN